MTEKDKPIVIEFDLEEVRDELISKGYPKDRLDEILERIQKDPSGANEFTTKAIKKTLNKHELEKGIARRWEQ